MSAQSDLQFMPDELQRLGRLRQLFESSQSSVLSSVARGLFPMAISVGLLLSAPRWFPVRDWKIYLLYAAAIGLFLNGVRVVLQAWRRRTQKIATFERGFAVWRHNRLSTFEWDRVEEIDVSPQFFGFAVICRTEDGGRKKFSFDTASDPTEKLRLLWREFEEESSRARIPAVFKTIDGGEDAVFVHKTWGKETGTKIAINRRGITATRRYKDAEFVEWPDVADVTVARDRFIITRIDEKDPWIDESLLVMPGYVAIQAAAEHARRLYQPLSEDGNR